MIEIFASRLQADSRPISSQLILNGVDRLSADAVPEVLNWLQRLEGKCMTIATSSLAAQAMAQRGPDWSRLIGRLSSIEIGLPGLVERREDIGPLALEALAQACAKADRAQLALSNEALGCLQVYDWPGNTRQLFAAMREAVSQAVLVSAIQPSHLPISIRTFPTSKTQAKDRLSLQPIDLDQVLLELERTIIRRALMANPRNRAKAARQLGISRPRLLRRIEQLGLQEYSPTLTEDADDESESN
jgi:DNA-binding NtrC family response regulator